MSNEIVLFEAADKSVTLPVRVDADTVWLNRTQIAELFERDVKTIGKHINNALHEELDNSVVAKFATTAADGKIYQVDHYSLDMIISVGYRVKSKRGVEFRRWANSILRQFVMQGYATNQNRLSELGYVVRLMQKAQQSLDTNHVLSVVEKYSHALKREEINRRLYPCGTNDYDFGVRPKREGNNDQCYYELYEYIIHVHLRGINPR